MEVRLSWSIINKHVLKLAPDDLYGTFPGSSIYIIIYSVMFLLIKSTRME